MTSERQQMTGWEYCDRLRRGQAEENHRSMWNFGVGGGGVIATIRSDDARSFKWRNYERLIVRLYGSGLVAVGKDGSRAPWSPEQLGDGE